MKFQGQCATIYWDSKMKESITWACSLDQWPTRVQLTQCKPQNLWKEEEELSVSQNQDRKAQTKLPKLCRMVPKMLQIAPQFITNVKIRRSRETTPDPRSKRESKTICNNLLWPNSNCLKWTYLNSHRLPTQCKRRDKVHSRDFLRKNLTHLNANINNNSRRERQYSNSFQIHQTDNNKWS